MGEIFGRDRILDFVNAMAEANGATYDVTKGNLEDLAKQTVSAAKVLQDFLEPKN